MTPASWAIVGLFVLAVCGLGGSSRPDLQQVAALRPLVGLFLIPALYLWAKADWRQARVPATLLALLTAWMVLQIVPLPPSIWQGLPDRGTIAELDRLAGAGDIWRPISLVPSRGINALASLIVPISALALALSLRLSLRNLLLIIAGIGSVDALLDFAQIATGANGPFYFYSVTNRGSPVGIFANENHSAVFSAIVMLVAAKLVLTAKWRLELRWLAPVGGMVFIVALLAVITSGSRAGFVMGLLALSASAIMAYIVFTNQRLEKAAGRNPRRAKQPKTRMGQITAFFSNPYKVAVVGIVLLAAVGALLVVNGKVAGLESITNQNVADDLRLQLLPILQTMASNHWLVGTGFGSFEEVYHIYEPTELLFGFYVNQAHNDWAQLMIEGGMPALVLLAGLFLWGALRVRLFFSANSQMKDLAAGIFWITLVGILATASIVDYPLRTPIFQVVAIWLIVALAIETHKQQVRAFTAQTAAKELR